jgi:hypothetical protein
MKIKIRPDGAGAPDSSEWAAMNEWLAELREDDETEPASKDETGTDSKDEAVRSGYAEPASNSYAEPASNSYAKPASDGYAGPDRGYTGPDAQAGPGTDSRERVHMASERYAGPDTRGYVRSVDSREPGVTPAAAAPLNRYASRTSAGTRATVSAPVRADVTAPAEAPLVRALIGDELRTPTAWCEMSSCISWHADRSALGEADIRARAIRAGWRVDALGRLACPRCQQTSASFRATRPVVPWDRATAITMAARATARGNHPGGPAAGTNGRGTRRPAYGQR